MTDERRRITPGNLARVALADVDEQDSLVYWDANEPVVTARTKRITIADLRAFVHASPVVVGTDPDSGSAAAFRVGGDSLLGGSVVVTDDLSVGGDATISGAVNLVGAVTLGSTFRASAITYTWPASQAADRFLRTDGAGNLSWALPLEDVALADLSDVAIAAPAAGQMLRYAGPGWANSSDGTSLNVSASNLTVGTVPNARLAGAYTGVVGLGIQTQGLQFDDALYDIGSGGKRPRDFALSRNATIGGTLAVTGAATAASFAGDGSGLTALNGTQVTTGTVAAARLAAHDLITAHTATGLTAGQVVRASGAAAFAFAVLQFADLGGVPTTIAGYGITDAFTKTESDARFAALVHVHSAADITTGTLTVTRGGTGVSNPTAGNLYLGAGAGAMSALAFGADGGYVRSNGSTWARSAGVAWADLTSVPTTVGGYGITDVYTKTASDARFAPIAVPWATITGTPTTVAGYGITDAITTAGGQTIAGALTVQQLNITKAAGTARTLHFTSAGSARWDFATESTAESGSNAGSALVVIAYDDAGTMIDTPITITRAAAGTIALARHVSAGTDAAFDLGSGNRFRDLILSRDATIGRNAAVTGTLGVTGTSTLGVVNAGATTTTTLHSTGAVTFDLALGAGATTVTTLHATGAVTFDVALPIGGGGTGVASFTAGDLPYFAAGTSLSAVAIGTASKMLRSTGTAPAWSTATFPNTATAGDLMVATGLNAWGSLAIGGNLRVLQSNGSAAAWVANLDIGTGTLNTGAATVTTLHATGAVTFDAALGAGATTVSTLHATGAVTFDSTLGAGATTVSTLHATGAVTLDSTATVAGITSSANVTANGAAATDRGVRVTTAGVLRWFVRGDSAAESGANAGTAFKIGAYDDAGVAIDDPIVITRAAGGTLFIQRPTNFTGNVEFASDAAYDIGATNRPRDFRLSRNASIGGTLAAGTTTITSASATAFVVGPNGTTNPVFALNAATVSQAAGVSITGAIAAGTVAFAVTSSGADANLSIDAKGAGTLTIGATSTGAVTVGVVTFSHAGAVGAVTTLAASSTVALSGTTDATNSTSGILQVAGGVGIAKKLYVGTALDVGTTSHFTGAATFDSSIAITGASITLDNGQYYKAKRSTGSAVVNMIGFDVGTDNLTIRSGGNGATSTVSIINTGGVTTFSVRDDGVAAFGGNVLAGTDASFDLGASGASRFRDFFLSRNATIGGTVTVGLVTSIGSGGGFQVTRRDTNAATHLVYATGDTTTRWSNGSSDVMTLTNAGALAVSSTLSTGDSVTVSKSAAGGGVSLQVRNTGTTGVTAADISVRSDATTTFYARFQYFGNSINYWDHGLHSGATAWALRDGQTGVDVMSATPTSGGVSAVTWSASFTGITTLAMSGNFAVNTNKFNVTATTGAFSGGAFTSSVGNGGTIISSPLNATTGAISFIDGQNTGARSTFGLESSSGGTNTTGSSAYAVVLTSFSTAMEIGSNNIIRLSISSAGAFDFKNNTLTTSGLITATGGLNSCFRATDGATTLNLYAYNTGGYGAVNSGTADLVFITSSTVRVTIAGSNGLMTVAGTVSATAAASATHLLSSNWSANYGTEIYNSNATNAYGLLVASGSAAGTGFFLIDAQSGASLVFRVRGDGNATNTNNSYGAISDERFKDVIGDAGSQLDDFRAYQFRKYRIHSSVDSDGNVVDFRRMSGVQIGLVAQEVRRVSPGLVDEDANGFLSIKYSVLAVKTAKALQEVIAIVDDYRADFDAVDEHFSAHELRILALESEVDRLTKQLAGLQPA